MKEFALGIALFLHATGLWSHTDSVARVHLANQALGQATSAPEVAFGTATARIVGLPLRQRDIPLDLSAKNVLAVDAVTMLPLYSKKFRSLLSQKP
jgi:hypothetical protein